MEWRDRGEGDEKANYWWSNEGVGRGGRMREGMSGDCLEVMREGRKRVKKTKRES